MISGERFRVNTPDVVHEIIEGEAVIVNLGNGVYYSVDRAGAEVWALIETRTPVPRIVLSLTGRYTGDYNDIATGVDQFISQLQAEKLIVADDDQTDVSGAAPADSAPAEAYKPKFEAPMLQRYTDMEDLLLLDPIHD